MGLAKHREGAGQWGPSIPFFRLTNTVPDLGEHIGPQSGGAYGMFYTWLQDEENDPALEVLLASSQKMTLNLGSLQVCRAEQKPVPCWGQSGRASEYLSKQWAFREAAGLARRKPRGEARAWADGGKAAGCLRGFSEDSRLVSDHARLYERFSAPRAD